MHLNYFGTPPPLAWRPPFGVFGFQMPPGVWSFNPKKTIPNPNKADIKRSVSKAIAD